MTRFHSLRKLLTNLFLLLFSLGTLSGCGKKAEFTTLQDEVDFSDGANLFSAPIPKKNPNQLPNSVIAVVDGSPVTYADLVQEVNVLLVSSKSAHLPPERLEQMRSRFSDQALQNVIVKKLLVNAVEVEKVTTNPDEVAKQIEQVRTNLPEGTTLDELLKTNSLSEEDFRHDLELSIRVQKLLELKVAHVEEATSEEVETFYTQNLDRFVQPESLDLRHLMVKVEEGADDPTRSAAQTKAEELRQQILDGADFAELASQHSDDPASRERGGALESIKRNVMQKPLNDAAFSLQPGELSSVLATPFGFHLLLVEARNPEQPIALPDVADRIRMQLTQVRKKQILDEYVTALKNQARIEIQETDATVHPLTPE